MKLPRKLVAAAAAVCLAFTGAPAVAAANAVAYRVLFIYEDEAYTGSNRYLTWINPNNCLNGSGGYNWYAVDAVGQQYYPTAWGRAMSSVINQGAGCNRLWLKSGPWNGPENYLYSQCVRYAHGIATFGYPYNDNIKQVGASYDPACPS